MRLFFKSIFASALCLMLASAPVLVVSEPVFAQKSNLKAGEIAFEGTVSAVNWKTLELQLVARRFILPNGKSSEIKPPKVKLVQLKIADAAVLKQKIKVGLELRVSGRDLGTGKPLRANSLSVLTPTQNTASVSPENGNITSGPPKSIFPIEGTSNGFRFSIESAKVVTTDADPRPTLRTLLLSFAPKQGGQLVTADWKNNLKVRMLSPEGLPIQMSMENGEIKSNLAPRYDWVWLEMTGRDPKSSDGLSLEQANGFWEDELPFDIPPPTPNQTIRIDKTLTTPHGGKLRVEELKFTPNAQGGVIDIVAQGVDNGASLTIFQGGTITPPDGKAIFAGGGNVTGSKSWSIGLSRIPSEKTWNLKLKVKQFGRNKAVSSGRFKVRLKLPVKSLPTQFLTKEEINSDDYYYFSDVVSTASGQNAEVRADIETQRSLFKGVSMTNLVLRDLSAEPNKIWDFKSAKAWDEDETPLHVYSQSHLGFMNFYNDGSPASSKATIRNVAIAFNAAKRPKSIKVRLNLESRRNFEYIWTLTTPLPIKEKVLYPDADVISKNNAPISLREIRLYQSKEELVGLENKNKVAERGMALVFESQPLIKGARMEMNWASVRDELGRPLDNDDFSGAYIQIGDVFSTQKKSGVWTAFLALPPANSQTIEIQGRSSEIGEGLNTISLDVENVLPPPPKGK